MRVLRGVRRGLQFHSKNTIDLNYLYVAEHRYQADVRTEHLAQRIVPLNASGQDDVQADGSHGYRVAFVDLNSGRTATSVLANRVVVSAGTLGSTELLLRCQRTTLPRVSARLGHRFSGNGDFLGFVIGTTPPAEPNYGPVITQGIDYNLLEKFDPERAFILEDASYPAFLAWFVEGIKPGVFRLGAIGRTIRAVLDRITGGSATGSIGYALSDLLSGDLSYHTAVLLSMGIDKSNGTLTLDRNGCIDLDWPGGDSRALYDAINGAGEAFKRATGAPDYVPIPTWLWPMRKNVTVHSLGGCVLADDPSNGVTDANRATFGQVFGYTESLRLRRRDRADGRRRESHRDDLGVVRDGRARDHRPHSGCESMTPTTDPVSVQFTEDMKGFVAFGDAGDYQQAFDAGKAAGTAFMFHLTIKVPDIEFFVRDPMKSGVAEGWIACDRLGGQRPVERGLFNCFVDVGAPQANTRNMRYRLFFRDGSGQAAHAQRPQGRRRRRDPQHLARHEHALQPDLRRSRRSGAGNLGARRRDRHLAHQAARLRAPDDDVQVGRRDVRGAPEGDRDVRLGVSRHAVGRVQTARRVDAQTRRRGPADSAVQPRRREGRGRRDALLQHAGQDWV